MTWIAVIAGVSFVIVGILAFKLPPFLALIGGAVAVGLLSPEDAKTKAAVQPHVRAVCVAAGDVVAIGDRLRQEVRLSPPLTHPGPVRVGQVSDGFKDDGTFGSFAYARPLTPDGRTRLDSFAHYNLENGQKVVERLVAATPGAVVLRGAMGSKKTTPPSIVDATQPLTARIAKAFGNTTSKIGLLIALAAVIGTAMQYSGAADSIVRATLNLVGEKRAPASLVGSGFLIGIPVFFDTVFYLMIPLARSLHARTGGNYLFAVLCIICGGTMAHSLVPPTPGPLYIASELGVSIGAMVIGGLVVGAFTAVVGYVFAWVSSRGATLEPPVEEADEMREDIDPDSLPPVWLSMLPILIPVILLAAGTSLNLPAWFAAVCEKNAALMVGATVSLGILVTCNRSTKAWPELVSAALMSGGMIVLITGAGGAFGAMLQQSGVKDVLKDLPDLGTAGLLTAGFLVCAAIRTAQGSSTVAMITTVGLFTDMSPEVLGCHPVYLALAIGCGGKPLAWMNDSAFWVMTRMSGMTPGQGLRYITPMTATMAAAGLAFIQLLAWLLPMT